MLVFILLVMSHHMMQSLHNVSTKCEPFNVLQTNNKTFNNPNVTVSNSVDPKDSKMKQMGSCLSIKQWWIQRMKTII